MNSPPDPGSPILTDSSGTPPPDDIGANPSAASQLINIAAQITHNFGSVGSASTSKRRLPGGSGYGGSSSTRDPKTRRRGEPGRQGLSFGSSTSVSWDTGLRGDAKRDERDLVDNYLVDILRKEIGDPFLERDIKRHS